MPTTSESRTIAAPAADIWAVLANLEEASRWNQAWQRVEYLSAQREGVGTTFRAYDEDGVGHNFRISEWAPNEVIAFVPLRDEPDDKRYLITLESQGFVLRPAGDGLTYVSLFASAAGHGPRGWITARIVWPGYQRKGLGRALESLRALFEPDDEREEGDEAPAED